MTTLQQLKKANPGLRLSDVFSPAFARYGKVLCVPDGDTLVEALKRTRMPKEGNLYHASLPSLEKNALIRRFQESVFGGMKVQAGCCNGFGTTMNAMEYHKCPEINVTTDGAVLLLGRADQLHDGTFDARDAVGFYLPPHIFVEIDPKVLHFAPLSVTPQGFRCLVVLEKHTNEAFEKEPVRAEGEDRLLWMRNKWMTCHPDSPQARKGAFIGIRGENLRLNPINR